MIRIIIKKYYLWRLKRLLWRRILIKGFFINKEQHLIMEYRAKDKNNEKATVDLGKIKIFQK